ncbi:hypothetical protein HDU76_000495, partial [Blyttiomyces sp. JEL0837]
MSFKPSREPFVNNKAQRVATTPAVTTVKTDLKTAKLVAKNDREVPGERTPELASKASSIESMAGSVKEGGKGGKVSTANGVSESSKVSEKKPRQSKVPAMDGEKCVNDGVIYCCNKRHCHVLGICQEPSCQRYSTELTRRRALAKELTAARNHAIDAQAALVNEKIDSIKRY